MPLVKNNKISLLNVHRNDEIKSEDLNKQYIMQHETETMFFKYIFINLSHYSLKIQRVLLKCGKENGTKWNMEMLYNVIYLIKVLTS